ncbi:MAG: pitrilysin family protein [Pseudomonadota bacterium]
MRALSFVVSFLVAIPAFAQVKVDTVTSPNGIMAWHVEEPSIPFIAIDIAFRGGDSMDPEGKFGAVEFVMAMLEEGTGDLDAVAFAQAQESLGARFSFGSERDSININASILNETRDASVDLLRRAMIEPSFDPVAFDRVKAQLESGYRSDLEDPREIGSAALNALAFPGHPYGRPLEGRLEQLQTITRDDLIAVHQDVLAKDRMIVSVVGDISANELGVLLDRLFDGLPDTGAPLPPRADYALDGGKTVIEFENPQSIASFVQPGITFDDPDFFPAFVMNRILGGGGLTSRLSTEIREKRGLTYGVGSYLATFDLAEVYAGQVASANEDIAEAVELIKTEWVRMAEEGVTEEELTAAQQFITGSYALRFDGNARIAGVLTGMQLNGLPISYMETRNNRVNAVTVEDIQRVAADLLQPEALHFVVVGQPVGIETQ